ncbi:MAG TPA: hypothetical protein VLF18_18740, partial [Tahibacter sp.]|uniref:hypothetical protein n=1 Tax=Tahibacter sp. TaxID=2056211 RepID=UPI002CC191D6
MITAFAARAGLLELLQAGAAREGRTSTACRLGRALRKNDAPWAAVDTRTGVRPRNSSRLGKPRARRLRRAAGEPR